MLTNDAFPQAWLAATATCDLIIVFATVFYMMKARQREYSTTTNVAVSRIIRVSSSICHNCQLLLTPLRRRQLSVETGVLCALFAIVDLSLYVAFDGNNYHLAACIWLSKVYSNSMMVVSISFCFAARCGPHMSQILNSRAHFGHATPGNGTQLNVTSIAFRSRRGAQTAVHVSTETDRADNSSHTRKTEDTEKDLGLTAHAV